jgi:cytochrome c6
MEPKRNWARIFATALLGSMFLLFFSLSTRSQAGGEALFKAKCAACHGADGKGETAIGKANKMNDLGSADVQKQSDADLTTTITNGKNKMPAYGKSLKPDQIKDLVAYIRGFGKKS